MNTPRTAGVLAVMDRAISMSVNDDYRDERIEARATVEALIEALYDCEIALADYIPTIEAGGATLNYGHSVLRQARAVLARAKGDQPLKN